MKIRIRIQDVEISFDDENKNVKVTPMCHERESGNVLSAIKSMTDDCIRAYKSTKPTN